MTWNPEYCTSKVYPSGAARFTAEAAITPEPPGRFSTITGLPSALDKGSAIMRAARSVVPPGAAEAIKVTVCVG